MLKAVQLPNLKKCREARQWTQDMMSELSGVSVRTIQRIESGAGSSLDSAKALAVALELPSVRSLQEDEPAEPPLVQKQASAEDACFPVRPHPMSDEERENHAYISGMRRQDTVNGALLLLVILVGILLTTEGRSALASTAASAVVVAGIGWGLTKLLRRAGVKGLGSGIVLISTLLVIILTGGWYGYTTLGSGFAAFQKKRLAVDVVKFARDTGMSMRTEQIDTGRVASVDDMQVRAIAPNADEWDRLVSKLQDLGPLGDCPDLRSDMTVREVEDWGQQCIPLQ